MKLFKTITFAIVLLWQVSCSDNRIFYKVTYDNGSPDVVDSTLKKEGKSIVFTEGFDENDVGISNGNSILYEEKITSNHITGKASDFTFIPEKSGGDRMVLSIEGAKVELTELNIYKYVYVTRKDNMIALEYSNRIWLFD